ncbi:MAG: glycosyltransferase family 2 protein [Candidatus Promineifilaceae bacterium]
MNVASLAPRPVLAQLTVVIPTLGRAILAQSLGHIAAGDAWPGSLMVVDQGASPQVAAWVEALGAAGIEAVYVSSGQRGRAAGLNRGIERCRSRYVAITDDDCFVRPDWLAKMAAQLEAHPDAIVTGRVEAGGDKILLSVTALQPKISRRPGLRFDPLSGGNMGLARAVLQRIGPFDEHESVRTAEDGELAYRALRAGVSIVYAPEVAVTHHDWRDAGQRGRQYHDYARSQGGFYGKYLRQGDWFIAARLGVNYARAARRALRGLLSGDGELRRFGVAYLTGMPAGVWAGLRRRPAT